MSEMYNGATMEVKKMIVSRMIQRVEVARNNKINVIFRPEYKGYFEHSDITQAEMAWDREWGTVRSPFRGNFRLFAGKLSGTPKIMES